jgi:hypothetical protein
VVVGYPKLNEVRSWILFSNDYRTLSKYGYTEEEPEDIGRFVTEETADGKMIRRPAGLKKGFRD